MIETTLVVAWVLLGLAFWVDITFIYGCPPDSWYNIKGRSTGWAETIFFYLPVCLLFGPVFWIIAWINYNRS